MTNEFVNNFTSASDIAYTAFRDIEGDVAEQKKRKVYSNRFYRDG